MKEKLIVILGPTATGKSNLAMLLAEKIPSEIVSGDSMLVYQGLDIGTAKPSKEELAKIPHHMIDILAPNESFNVAEFQTRAAKIITQINQANKIPILVGGTGLYIKSLLEGYKFSEAEEDSDLRQELEVFAQEFGNKALHEKLAKLSPIMANSIHPNNVKRVIRAIELAQAGEQIVPQEKATELVYDAVVFGLRMDRAALYERINQRVEMMFAAGLVDEVQKVLTSGVDKNSLALQGIGYKEVVDYLDKKISYDKCMELVARNTRRFAKRQFTWYKKMPYINWYDVMITDNILENILIKLEENFNLE